jgi:RimJ/RimL family protein N-acetyltransferase
MARRGRAGRLLAELECARRRGERIDAAFAEAGVARLELASQRVAERCGFTREALLGSRLPFRGGRRDTVVYGLLPGELR